MWKISSPTILDISDDDNEELFDTHRDFRQIDSLFLLKKSLFDIDGGGDDGGMLMKCGGKPMPRCSPGDRDDEDGYDNGGEDKAHLEVVMMKMVMTMMVRTMFTLSREKRRVSGNLLYKAGQLEREGLRNFEFDV